MKCTECNGTGEIEVHSEMLMCPECFGKGEVKEHIIMTPTNLSSSIPMLKALIRCLRKGMNTLNLSDNDQATDFALLCTWNEKAQEALKDAQFDQETNPLPFPEK